jgi:hypothetical protein
MNHDVGRFGFWPENAEGGDGVCEETQAGAEKAAEATHTRWLKEEVEEGGVGGSHLGVGSDSVLEDQSPQRTIGVVQR